MTTAIAIRRLLGAASLLLGCGPANPGASATRGGTAVTHVDSVDTTGDAWIYEQIGDTTWEERKGDGTETTPLEETGRDRANVYLEDADRGVTVTIDLAGNQVEGMGQDGTSTVRTITGKQATVKGFCVSRVTYGDGESWLGSFARVDESTWEERNSADAPIGEYRKGGEDEWSVYLTSASGGGRVQLDLWQSLVLRSGETQEILATWRDRSGE